MRPASHGTLRLAAVRIADSLRNPVGIVNAGDGSHRLFFILQGGRIVIHRDGRLLADPFLDVTSLVSCCGERGLLGLAFHPQFETNGVAFVNYTDLRGDTVVARYTIDPSNRDRLDPASGRTILKIEQPFSNHNGGHLEFGPDGYLYIGTGDGGSAGDPMNKAQDLGELLGKMLRIDVDSGTPYSVPPSNPFVGRTGVRPEIWAYGLRNPWMYTFDRDTGDLWIADVGQNAVEEVNFQPASSRGGENYGWRKMEGSRCFNPSSNCNDGTLVLPVAEYTHSRGCSVTGGFVYRGRSFRDLRGIYVFGDLCSGTIWGTSRSGDGFVTSELLDTPFTIATFGEDEAGELYVADYSGSVYRLIDASSRRERPVRRGQ